MNFEDIPEINPEEADIRDIADAINLLYTQIQSLKTELQALKTS